MAQNFSELANFIWSVANLLRGDYKQADYGKVILPFTLLRRLDCVLADTKQDVLAEYEKRKDSGVNLDLVLPRKSKQSFYNVSPLTLPGLLADPANIRHNLLVYIGDFSADARDVFERFKFTDRVAELDDNNLLHLVTQKFAEIDLHPSAVPNETMGLVFEELIRKFSEASNETAGEHFTPREVIKLIVHCLFAGDDEALSKPGVNGKRELEAVEGRKLSAENEDLSKYKKIEPGDIVYNKMRMWQGAVGVARFSALISPAYIVATPARPVDSRFLGYFLKSERYVFQSGLFSYGICGDQNSLRWEEFANLKTPLPSLTKQESIANFLDEQTARIDALIAGKEKLRDKLEELRLSQIYTTLSQGLDIDVSRQKTHDEWFRAVPAHWAFCPLNYRYEVQLGKMLDEKRISGDHLLPFLRNTDVQWDRVNLEGLPMMDFAPHELERYTVRYGDLLVCEGGEVGRSAIWMSSEVGIGYQKALHRVKPRNTETDMPRFLFYALYDSAKRGRFQSREKATIAHLTAEAFRRYRFPFPPYSEQVAIVRHLDGLMRRIDALQKHTDVHRARLQEYRSSLISAAVTGQIDINNFQLGAA